MKVVDLKDMPKFNTKVSNGTDSVSSGRVYLKSYPCCKEHGAMNKVSKDGIWRCLSCNEGCYEVTK